MIKTVVKPFILIDGSSYLHRAYYALPTLTNSAGEPTGAIYGVLNMLRSLIIEYQPTYVAVVFDAKGKTFRDEIFMHYKSHRPPMPDDLQSQIKPLYFMIKAMGLPLIIVEGVEADDVIGTLAYQAEKDGHSVLISTNDKDMAQLVTPYISLINVATNTILGPKEVLTKYGVPPEMIIDFLALTGDISDNIPGVPRIGKKTAVALLQSIGKLDTLYSELGKIACLTFRGAKSIATKLKQNREIAYLSYQLATIKTDVELKFTYKQLKVQQLATKKLLVLFKRYEFKAWTADIKAGNWLQSKKTKAFLKLNEVRKIGLEDKTEKFISSSLFKEYEIILNETQLIIWIAKLKKASVFSFNIEVDSINNTSTDIIGLSFAVAPGIAAYVPVIHDCLDTSSSLTCVRVLELLKPILEDKEILKIGENLKYSLSIFQNYNIKLHGITFDVSLESYILDNSGKCHNVSSLAERWLRHKVSNFKKIAAKKDNHCLALRQVILEKTAQHAAEYVNVILQLHLVMWPRLQKHERLLYIFQNIEIPLVSVLSRIERNGVKIDLAALYRISRDIELRMRELEQKAYDITGESFNLLSTKQLQIILFEKQRIKPLKKTPCGALSTSEEVLRKLTLKCPLAKVILEYRGLAKLKSNYTDKLPLMINFKTRRIHTCYHQVVTTTGRLSSTDPNLQNIPIRNEEGKRIRQAFIAPENYLIISADYSQIELRIVAHFSRDEGLLKAFAEGKDIHSVTAAEVFELPLKDITDKQRYSAKAINFGLIFGISAFGLSRQLNIPIKESQKYINRYFERYPGVLEYIERIKVQAKKRSYVETLYGRRLYLPDIKSSNAVRRAIAERAAVNAPIQGTAADIIKYAMISVDAWIKKEEPRVKMIMQVHDELVFEVYEKDVKAVENKIHKLMEDNLELIVPLLVRMRSGKNWGQVH